MSRAVLVRALTGAFDGHHAELARMLLDQIDQLSRQVATLTTRIEELVGAIPAARGVDADGTTGPGAGLAPGAAVRPAAERLDEIPGVSLDLARAIIAETGLDMTRFPTADHLVSWAGLAPVAREILVIIWHLLADPAARYTELGAGYYASRIDKDKKARNHVRQLEALGFAVTLTQAA